MLGKQNSVLTIKYKMIANKGKIFKEIYAIVVYYFQSEENASNASNQ